MARLPGGTCLCSRLRRSCRCLGRFVILAIEPTQDATDDSGALRAARRRDCDRCIRTAATRARFVARRTRRSFLHHAVGYIRRRLIGHDGLDRRFLARLDLFRTTTGFFLVFGLLDHLKTGRDMIHLVQFVVAQALNRIMWRLQMNVRDQQNIDFQAGLELLDLAALLIQQEGRYVNRNLDVHCSGVFLHRLLAQNTQHVQRGGLDTADMAGAAATRAGNVAGLSERGLQPLARKLQQAEAGDLSGLNPGAIVVKRLAQPVFHIALILHRFHIDEVDDDQTAQIAQPQLACDFVGGLEVRAQCCFLDVVTLGRARRVDVDRNQRFGVVDHHGAAGRQAHLPGECRLDLVLYLETREQRDIIAIQFDLVHIARHHGLHERLGLFENLFRIDQDLADVRLEIIADRADHETRLQIDQEGLGSVASVLSRGAVGGGLFDGAPQLHEVAHVPLEFLDRPADSSCPGDYAHTLADLELVYQRTQFVSILTLHATRNTATARVVGHQYEIASRQADESRKRRALVAALVLFDLDDELLAFLECVLDAGFANFCILPEVALGDFLERQEAVPFLAIIDEGGLETGLDAGDDTLVNVALALFPCCRFDVEVDKLLAIDDCNAQFFLLRRVK